MQIRRMGSESYYEKPLTIFSKIQNRKKHARLYSHVKNAKNVALMLQ